MLGMKTACNYLTGTHDFRNLCKMDIAHVSNFIRIIYTCNIILYTKNKENSEYNIYMLEINGIAFLWHQIRCIMAVLLLIGQNYESPEVILYLLDIEKCIAKPDYNMAGELPLVLHHCGFERLQVRSAGCVCVYNVYSIMYVVYC